MPVGVLHIAIHLPGAHSLKEKRAVLRRVKDRLRAKFNVSVAEMAEQELWQRATLGVAAIGPDRAYLEGLLDRAAREAAGLLAGEQVEIGEAEILEEV